MVMTPKQQRTLAGRASAAKTIEAERNAEMVRMADGGYSFGEIAAKFGTSRARAHQIVKRERARRASAAA
jgi:hypothetical protein